MVIVLALGLIRRTGGGIGWRRRGCGGTRWFSGAGRGAEEYVHQSTRATVEGLEAVEVRVLAHQKVITNAFE